MNPSQASPNAYLRTKVMTASSGELRLMLFDGAIKFGEQGRAGLAESDYQMAYTGISRCQEILMELITSLRPDEAPELCRNLAGLYTFMYTRLIDAIRDRSAQIADEVLGLLRYERETWSMLLTQLAEENAAAGHLEATPEAQPPQSPSEPASKLIGGSISVKG